MYYHALDLKPFQIDNIFEVVQTAHVWRFVHAFFHPKLRIEYEFAHLILRKHCESRVGTRSVNFLLRQRHHGENM